MKEIFAGNTVIINLNTGIDISGYVTLEIMFKRPDGTEGSWTAVIDPANVKRMTYTTLAVDLNQSGRWTVQARVESVGAELHGRFANFTVLGPIDEVPS